MGEEPGPGHKRIWDSGWHRGRFVSRKRVAKDAKTRDSSMPIYDKPTKTLMREFAEQRLGSEQAFGKSDAVRWFAEHYPEIRPTTIQAHVEAMAVNSRSRKHHANVKPGSGHDLFFKVGPGRYRLWDPESDPRPIYGGDIIAAEKGGDETVGDVEDEDEELGAGAAAREFAFERDLRNYLA